MTESKSTSIDLTTILIDEPKPKRKRRFKWRFRMPQFLQDLLYFVLPIGIVVSIMVGIIFIMM